MGFLIVSLITSCLISFLISSFTSGCIFLIFFCGLTGSISVFAPLQFLGCECLKLFNVIFLEHCFNVIFLEHCSHSTNSTSFLVLGNSFAFAFGSGVTSSGLTSSDVGYSLTISFCSTTSHY